MKITKYIHSCLLVETPERVAIFDPGQFSWESQLINLDMLTRLDDIFITHEHPDHFYLPFLQALIAKFPEVRVTTNASIKQQLSDQGIVTVLTEPHDGVELLTVPHESLAPLDEAPEHIGFHYLDYLTHPGDSQHFSESKAILALPMTAPWGSLVAAAEVAQNVKPRYIIPIHDWHWNQAAREQAYDRMEAFFKERDSIFIKPQDGVAFEV